MYSTVLACAGITASEAAIFLPVLFESTRPN